MCRSFSRVYRFGTDPHEHNFTRAVFTDTDQQSAKEILQSAREEGNHYLSEDKAVQLLEAYRLPVARGLMATSEEQAIASSAKLGFPVAMKVFSPDIIHKTDVKGVVLNVGNATEAENAYRSIMHHVGSMRPDARIRGVYVSKMIEAGREVILGIKRDPSFGAVIMFGLGGIFVELYRDVSFRIAPLSESAAMGMIKDIKAYELLNGARGMEKFDTDSIKNCLMRLSRLAMDFPEISELDINPMIVLAEGKGCFVADAKVVIQ
jgi:acetate---CoA ligase (ADP-forming)